jgi:hypothetical protein
MSMGTKRVFRTLTVMALACMYASVARAASFVDEFSGTSLDTTNWIEKHYDGSGSVSIVDGWARVDCGGQYSGDFPNNLPDSGSGIFFLTSGDYTAETAFRQPSYTIGHHGGNQMFQVRVDASDPNSYWYMMYQGGDALVLWTYWNQGSPSYSMSGWNFSAGTIYAKVVKDGATYSFFASQDAGATKTWHPVHSMTLSQPHQYVGLCDSYADGYTEFDYFWLNGSGGTVPTVSVTVATSPSGATFSVDGTSYTSSRIFSWTPDSTHELSVTSPQQTSGAQYVFTSWSDGGAQTHTYTVPDSAATVTASFSAQFKLTAAVSPAGSGSVSPDGESWYDSGATVSVSAAPDSGTIFIGWSGDLSGIANPQDVTMWGPTYVTANFASLTDDSDGDGLSNDQEIGLGTDPVDPDTDGDGMEDGWEVDNSFDPKTDDGGEDADLDGYTNVQEFIYGSDPHDPESGLPSLSSVGSCTASRMPGAAGLAASLAFLALAATMVRARPGRGRE